MSRLLIAPAALTAAAFAVASLAVIPSLQANSIYGGPTYDSTTGTGYQNPDLPTPGTTGGDGIASGSEDKYSAGTNLGYRAIRWDDNGNFSELDNLGTDPTGHSEAHAMNSSDTVVGYASKYSAGTNLGYRAVRWDANSTTATELDNLGTNTNGVTTSVAYDINDTGIAVGYAYKYTGNTQIGSRAVRWDAGGAAATELGNLGTDSNGSTTSVAYAINATGTAVGSAEKYTSGTDLGSRAVRWDAGTTTATELGNLGTDTNGNTDSEAVAINAAGTAIGEAEKYIAGVDLGPVAVRWDAGGTTATELGHLGTDSDGYAYTEPDAINSAGIIVGYVDDYSGGKSIGDRAVFWGPDGVAFDLNSLLSPQDAAHWTLADAADITDSDWITGTASYDPDGAGPDPAYSRTFLIQLPEPASLSLLALAAISLPRRKPK